MRLHLLLPALFLPLSLAGQPAIMNEVYNSGSSDEWIEILVLQEGLDLRGWDLRDFTSGGNPRDPLEFTNSSLWSSLRSGTIILAVKPSSTIEEDHDPGDFLLAIKTDNDEYFTGTSFTFAGASDAIGIRNSNDIHVFGISWGSGNLESLPDPRVHFDGASSSNTSAAFISDTLEEVTDPGNWMWNNDTPSAGMGNSKANSLWIESMRSSGNGSGMAGIHPDTVTIGNPFTLDVLFHPEPEWVVTGLRIVIPPILSWSRDPEAVTFTGSMAALSISGDTITLSELTILANSTTVSVADVDPADTTGSFEILVQSRVTEFVTLYPVPSITIQSVTETPVQAELPQEFRLFQNFPNPFNPTTTIRYSVPETRQVTLSIYDILGRKVRNLVNESVSAGEYGRSWDAGGLPGGVYYYRMRSGDIIQTKRMILLK